jgi:alpha-1,3-rhamnosyl/mannosyltransferase
MLADGELDGVRRLGFVAEDDLVALYGAASVFAYPSLAEGFGLPVLEAMACGAPVLTSDVSSLPEVAGGAARLVDPLDVDALRDALRGLLEDPDERERLRGLGLRRAADLSWAATARRMLELYREVARLPPGP